MKRPSFYSHYRVPYRVTFRVVSVAANFPADVEGKCLARGLKMYVESAACSLVYNRSFYSLTEEYSPSRMFNYSLTISDDSHANSYFNFNTIHFNDKFVGHLLHCIEGKIVSVPVHEFLVGNNVANFPRACRRKFQGFVSGLTRTWIKDSFRYIARSRFDLRTFTVSKRRSLSRQPPLLKRLYDGNNMRCTRDRSDAIKILPTAYLVIAGLAVAT